MNGAGAGAGPAPRSVTVTITLDVATGNVTFAGPLQKPELCLEMLQAATSHLFSYVRGQVKPAEKRQVVTLDDLGVSSGRRTG